MPFIVNPTPHSPPPLRSSKSVFGKGGDTTIDARRFDEEEVKQLVYLAQQGNEEAMNELLLMFIPFRRGLVWKFSINEFYSSKDVEDVRRQVDLCFTSAVLSYDPAYNSPAVVHIISKTRHDVLSFYRKEIAYQERHINYGGLSEVAADALLEGVVDQLDAVELKIDIINILKDCNDIDKLIFLKCFCEDKTQQEVAKELGVSRSFVQRSVARLRKMFEHLNDFNAV